ncbi:MAG TPA: metalloregulator ArsR/SmtB family transcription factor [Anaerolineaceae bacterium]|jgi:ArsR family transcriptional regulator|nr:winged helix-turn-helix transcriptional regulator [Anaerolineaceae bacterium]HOT25401.1 metalloregulator ArsR/SmtB family transcription factor [Anaerolineaceae bacterium]HQH57387.1 metalloregulator ArsR/SmtB family transcription factor [Anaerolineaceae bacterium]HQK03303.1 metalloregulator ArsR/SmtB family transcription factor [Anaerolineaceae bacterium]HQL28319.1 metalloregulator ArsR/SmtB family transcription factor [Anaerolineaceae bacterium]
MNTIEKQETMTRDYAAQAALLKALAHPTRLAILYILRNGSHCVCHIESCLGHRQAYVSQQLSVLREAGLVQITRTGWNIYYAVSNPAIFSVLEQIQAITGSEVVPTFTPPRHCSCPECQTTSKKC